MAVRKPFGGMTVSFGNVSGTTLGEVFGGSKLAPSEMTKKLWAFVKRKGLMGK